MNEVRIKELADILGIATLIGFTLVITLIALASRGALLYFYEPNKFVWAIEVGLGFYGVIVGCKRLKEIVW